MRPSRRSGWYRRRAGGAIVVVALVAAVAALAGEVPPAGGLAYLTAEDVQVLGEARTQCEAIARDEAEHAYVRAEALGALNRIHEALNDWHRPEVYQWYWDLLTEAKSGHLYEKLLAGAQAAARGGGYHLGGVRAFWRKFDREVKPPDEEATRQIERARKTFEDRAKRFETPPKRSPPNVKLLQVRPQGVDVGRHVKPYPEPKPKDNGKAGG